MGHEGGTEKMRNQQKILIGRHDGKKPFDKHKCTRGAVIIKEGV